VTSCERAGREQVYTRSYLSFSRQRIHANKPYNEYNNSSIIIVSYHDATDEAGINSKIIQIVAI